MPIEEMKQKIRRAIYGLPVVKITLFGSRAEGTQREDSDVDLIVEFSEPVSLLALSALRFKLEDALCLDVDLIHGPLKSDDMITVGKEIPIHP